MRARRSTNSPPPSRMRSRPETALPITSNIGWVNPMTHDGGEDAAVVHDLPSWTVADVTGGDM